MGVVGSAVAGGTIHSTLAIKLSGDFVTFKVSLLMI